MNDIEIDGGTYREIADESTPRHIASTDITYFACEFSTFALSDENELSGRLYALEAHIRGGTATITQKHHDRNGNGGSKAFKAHAAFINRLATVIKKHDLVKYNGHVCRTGGLPDMYGACLDIRYASGESVYAYDNGDNFLTPEAMKQLVSLFKAN